LAEALHTQVMWNVRELSLWNDGTYVFVDNELPPPRTATPRIEAARVAMEIVRYQHEWNDLRQYLPDGMHTLLRMALEPPLEHPLIFSAAVWRVVTRVNAFATPRRIATALYQPEMETARMLAPLVRDALLYASLGEHRPQRPLRNIAAQQVDVFGLISRMEQEWRKRKALADQLAALATFINWTMEALAEAWAHNNLPIAPDSLVSLLQREHCAVIVDYSLHIERNHIAIDELTAYLRQLQANARRMNDGRDLQAAYMALSAGLRVVFATINARNEDPQDRAFHEAAWTALFDEFSEHLRPY
jgi:hypothetical protein